MKIKIKHVQQPTNSTCVHACLSMVTGIEVEELIDRFGGRGLCFQEEATVLTEMGIYPCVKSVSAGPTFTLGSVYFVTTPSLNAPGFAHAVVVNVTDAGDIEVFDPNEGRAGKAAYPRDALQPGPKTSPVMNFYSNIIELQPLPGHRGEEDRKRLWALRSSQDKEQS